MDSINAQNVTLVSHLEQIHILNTAEQRWMFGMNCCCGLCIGFTANKTAKETEVSQKLVHRCFIIIKKSCMSMKKKI